MANATTVITGKITTIFDSEIVGQNFEKRIFYVEELGSRYPNTWKLELQQGKCNDLDLYNVGDEVICKVEIRGKTWVNRQREEIVFTTLKVNDIELANAPSNNQPRGTQQHSEVPPAQQGQANKLDSISEKHMQDRIESLDADEFPEDDDLPF